MELHTIRYGDAPVEVVLVHGLASNARMWDGVGAALAERGVGAIAVDLRGHGGSPKPDTGYDFDSVVGDLLPLLDGRPLVAGQSYGGNVAVHLAAHHPERVRGIVCVDGGAIDLRQPFPNLDDALVALKPPYEQFVGTLRTDVERRLRHAHPDWPETGLQGALACHDVDANGRIQVFLTWPRHRQIVEAMWRDPPTELFPKVTVPVLFLVASARMRGGVETALEVLEDGRAVFFDGAHHDVHAQKPVEVAEHFMEML